MDAPDEVPAVPAQRRAERSVLHSETRALTDTIDRLAVRFPLHSRATVADIVGQAHQEFDESDVRDYVPLLVEREARRRLKHITTHAAATHEAPTQEASSERSQARVG